MRRKVVLADGSILEAVQGAGGGTVYRVRVIRAGLSLNRRLYPGPVLREALPLFNGARVFVKGDTEHLAGGGKDVRNLIGGLKDARWVEADESIEATLTLITGPDDPVAKELFSQYIVMGQQASSSAFDIFLPGGSDRPERPAASPSARVTDPSVTRYRPTIILAEMQGTGLTLAQRAEWERAVALGKAIRGTYTVPDWKAGDTLWQPNTLVRVTDAINGLDAAEMLIASTRMSLDDGGTLTEIEVTHRDAYRLIPEGVEGGTASALDPFRIFDSSARR